MGIKHYLIILTSFLIVACGATKKTTSNGSSNLPSRGGNGDLDNDTKTPINFYSECNTFSGEQHNGNLTTYLDPITSLYNYEWIRLKFKSVPVALLQSEDFYIQFFKWNEEVEGKPYVHSKPVEMYFQFRDGRLLRSSTVNFISKALVEDMISQNALGDTDKNNFFSRVTIILTGLELSYDALLINTYDSSKGTAAQSTARALLPAFAADPNLYQETHTSSLNQLHPFWDTKDNGWTENQYHQESLSLCN